MSRKTVRIVTIALVVAAGLVGQSLFALTRVVVGPSTCMPAYPHYSDIQTAVSSVPLNTIVMVCPGTYPQQIVISQPLTLEGVTDGTHNAAVITVPGAGLVQNGTSTSFGPVAVQLLVQNTVGVTIKNLTVDGNGGNCPANRNVGIGVFDVGTPNDGTAAARIDSVVVRNDTTCFGDGILADTSYITITGSEIHDVNQTAIDAYSAKYSITNNSIQRAHNYGIVLVDDATGSVVSGNNVSDGNTGILSEGPNSATITNNTLLNNSFVGVWVFLASHQIVTQNVVSNSAWDLIVEEGSSNTVQNNKFNGAGVDGILDFISFGGNNITKNTVNEGQFGIFADNTTSGDTLVPNAFYNVVTTIDPGPPQVPPDPVQP
jgi:parallel beta-helix repeat protein